MRKELKMIGSKDRHIFTATFIRFGFRDGYKGSVETILLQDVLLNGKVVTDHLWFDLTDNIRPFLSIRIRGKDEIIPFKDKKEIQSVKAHLCSIFSGFVKIGDRYLKMSEVKEYKPVTAEDMNPYILFKTSKFGNIKVRFPKDEDMDAELLVLDQLFDVE